MSDGFYARGLKDRGLKTLVPDESDQDTIHRVIYDELICGVITQASINRFADIGRKLLRQGADAILLGCTELELLARNGFDGIEVIDSNLIHANTAWEKSFSR
jgi:aspartate racemase